MQNRIHSSIGPTMGVPIGTLSPGEVSVAFVTTGSIAIFEPGSGVAFDDPLDGSIAGLTLAERSVDRVLSPRTLSDSGDCACSYVDWVEPGVTATWFAQFEGLTDPGATVDVAIPRFGIVTLTPIT